MTRASKLHLLALKEKPADAELISHQLMLRAGLITQVTSGIYNWMPLGLRILQKVENIICEEMEAIACNRLLLPVVQPAELWQESGRWQDYGHELLRFRDRHDRQYCLAPTHEEIMTDMVRQMVRSYKDLPLSFFQVQTKFRDEIRPRFGIMRSREFIMKDAYSFHSTAECLNKTYLDMLEAYKKIFDRIGFRYCSVSADGGSIGGDISREFHVLADSGEDTLAISTGGHYAANTELVTCFVPSDADELNPPEPQEIMKEVDTPGSNTIDALCRQLDIKAQQTIKVIVVHARDSAAEQIKLVGLILRGDHRMNQFKAQDHPAVLSPIKLASKTELESCGLSVGYLGPVNSDIDFICDYSAALLADFVCGSNIIDKHYRGVNWQRDCNYREAADLREISSGDPSPDGNGTIEVHRGIEVGHIFQLGTKYSEAMSATIKNENNQDLSMHMGCYGIGVTRIVAAYIEQVHDENGIIWPTSIAPFHVHIIALRYKDSEQVRETANSLYRKLQEQGIDVLLDDRALRAGILFSQADLFGVPLQLVISDRNIAASSVELITRATRIKQLCPTDRAIAKVMEILEL